MLLHQPPFEVRIGPDLSISVINCDYTNTLYLDANRNYAMHICNNSGQPIYLLNNDVGILEGLLLIPAQNKFSSSMLRTDYGSIGLSIVFGTQETKTFGTYSGSIRIK